MPNQPPKHLNLLQIRLPIAGVASILHRISGVFLLLALPFSLYVLEKSLASPASFQAIKEDLQQPFFVIFSSLVIMALIYHLIAGIRYLLIDLDFFLDRNSSRLSAIGVIAAAALLSSLVIIGVYL
ncbi:MAG: succinate dehydrogenase, cytochrome b556 subunit [bacterium]